MLQATGKTKCGCGRTFDGMSGFKSHEKCAHLQTFYATRDREREFANSQAPQAPALLASSRFSGEFILKLCNFLPQSRSNAPIETKFLWQSLSFYCPF